MASNFKRLYEADNVTGFSGNRLTENDFNNIIKEVLMINPVNSSFNRSSFDYGNGVSGDLIRGTDGLVKEITIRVRQITDGTPFLPNTDKTIYSNSDIKNVDGTSDYSLFRPDGTLVDKTAYVLRGNGEVVWGQSQTAEFFTMNGLEFITTVKITITRDAEGSITGFDLLDVS